MSRKLWVVVIASSVLGVGPARANERRFPYAYESPVLPAGAMEVELWTTPRLMRDHYFVRFDQRIEFEVGLGRNVQTAFYLNTRGQAETTPNGMSKKYDFRGVSSEWKWQWSDPAADWLGSALYWEVTWMPHEVELEAKVILDKWIGPVLLAYNLVAEYEIEAGQAKGEDLEWEKVTIIENILGASIRVADGFHAGIEVLNTNHISKGRLDYSALFLGPNLSYADGRWWAALTFLAQVPAFRNSEASPHGSLVLDDLERYQARLLLGYHF